MTHIYEPLSPPFSDDRDRIKAHEEIDAGSLFDAMLNERSHHDVVEIWAGNRWIYRAARTRENEPEIQ
jgi:hypothetical protein